MAVQFNIDSRFNEDARYKKVLFGFDGQLLEVELNELQDILNARLSEVLDNVFGTRPLFVGTYTITNGTLTIANEVIAGNRELILLTSSSIAVTNGDTIYLNIQDTTKAYTDSIKQFGDQNSQTSVTNAMLDSRVGAETTRRVQTTFMLTKTNTNPGTNIQLCTISGGAVVKSATSSFADSNLYKEIRRLANEQITTNNLQPLKNVYGTVTAGGVSMPATSTSDTLSVVAGTAVTVAGNASTRTLTISSPNATTSADGSMSAADKTKLNGIATGAEVNQFAWSNVTAGGTTVASGTKTDTLAFVAGTAITLAGNASTKTVTVSSPNATTSADGSMSAADKTKLNSIATGAEVNQFAWSTVTAGGTTIASGSKTDTLAFATSGAITLAGDAVNKKVTIGVPNATQASDGTMSAADKQKLDGMQAGASINQNAYSTMVAGGTTMAATTTQDTFTISGSGAITVSGASKTATIGVNTATTAQAGVTQLTDSYTSTSTTTAATANSAKMAYDNAVAWAKGYGIGTVSVSQSSGADINTLVTNGLYYVPSGVNKPSGAGNGYVLVQAFSASYISQMYTDYANGNVYMRVNNNGTWGAWYQIASTAVATGSANGLMSAADKTKLDAINQALATTSTPTFAGLSSSADIAMTGASAHLKPAASGSIGFSNNAGTAWGLYVTDGASPSAKTFKNTLDDGTGAATFIGRVTSPAFTSTIAQGTPPFYVTSTTKVVNLNADMVDGFSFDQSVQTTDTPTFAGLNVNGASSFGGVASFNNNTMMKASGTATSANTYGSYSIQLQSSTWNGSAAVANIRNIFIDNTNTIQVTNTSAANVASIDNSGNIAGSTLKSTVATGTAPLTVTSTTKVTNLNADQVDGYNFNQSLQTTDSPSFVKMTSTVATGTAPLTVSSTTVVTSLNADMVDGYHMNQDVTTSGSPSFSKMTSTVATGTAPLTVASTTVVANLNADMVDGYHFNQSLQTTNNVTFASVAASTLTSTVATGTAPFTVNSTTKVINLNADMVDGYSFNQSLQTGDSPSFNRVISTVATGTAPLSVNSTTAVINLNADMVDGYHMNQDVRSTASPSFAGMSVSGMAQIDMPYFFIRGNQWGGVGSTNTYNQFPTQVGTGSPVSDSSVHGFHTLSDSTLVCDVAGTYLISVDCVLSGLNNLQSADIIIRFTDGGSGAMNDDNYGIYGFQGLGNNYNAPFGVPLRFERKLNLKVGDKINMFVRCSEAPRNINSYFISGSRLAN